MTDTMKEILSRLEAQDRQVDDFSDVRERLLMPDAEKPPLTARMRRRMALFADRLEEWGGGSGGLFSDASLYHNFAEDRNLNGRAGPALDFSRASGAMQYDSTGKLIWAPENLCHDSDDFTQASWTKRGAVATPGPNEITGIGVVGVDDIFNTFGVGLSADYRFEFGFDLRTVSTTGTLEVINRGQTVNGRWQIDLSQISTVAYERITRDHPAVTVVADFTGTTNNGFMLAAGGGTGPLHVFARQVQANRGTFVQPYSPTTTAAFFGPRFDYDPSTLESLGLLVEEQGTNLCLQSENVADAVWLKFRATVTSNAAVAPDGNTTADKLIANTDNNTHVAQQEITGVADDADLTFTCFIEKADMSWFALSITGKNNVNVIKTWFDLDNGVVGTTDGTGTASIQDVGSGRYRCRITGDVGAAVGNPKVNLRLADADNSDSFAGNGTDGTYVWGSDVKVSVFPTSYVPTTTATVVRSADVCTTADVSWYNRLANTVFADIYYRHADGLNLKTWGTVHAGTNIPRQGFSPTTFRHAVTTHDGTVGTFTGDSGGRAQFTDDQSAKVAYRWLNADEQGFKDSLGSPQLTASGVSTDLSAFTPTTFELSGSVSSTLKLDQLWIKSYAAWNVDKGAAFIEELIP